MRDRILGSTIYIKFPTRAFATGIPTTLLGTPVISAFEDGNPTPITAGITLSVDHGGIVGRNLITIVATNANGYNAGGEYDLTITAGTVDGVSVVGESGGEFSIESAYDPVILHKTTIATLTSQLVFTLTDGSVVDNAYVGASVIIRNPADQLQREYSFISGYVGATKEVTLNYDSSVYTASIGDIIDILMAPSPALNTMLESDNGIPALARFTTKALENSPASGGQFVQGLWKWDTNTAATQPNDGDIKVDNSDYTLVTNVYMSGITDNGSNSDPYVNALEIGDRLQIQKENDGSRYINVQVIAPVVDNTGWFTVPVSVVSNGTTIGNNNTCKVQFRYVPEAQPLNWADLDIEAGTGRVDIRRVQGTDQTAGDIIAKLDTFGASSGGAIAFSNNGDNVLSAIKGVPFVGVETSGDNTSINFEDGAQHVIDDSAGNIDIVYQFDVGGSRRVVEVTWVGIVNSGNDSATLQVYNGATWDTLATISGQNNTSNNQTPVKRALFVNNTGVGADLGLAFVRLTVTGGSNPTIRTDQLYMSAVNTGQSVGYALGRVWLNTVNGFPGTESFVNGVADKKALTWGEAITIATDIGLSSFDIAAGSTVQLVAPFLNSVINSVGATLDLNGQDITSSSFERVSVSGVGIITAGSRSLFTRCRIAAVTLGSAIIENCGIDGTITLQASASDIRFARCHALNGLAVIDFTAATFNHNIIMPDYQGQITLLNYNQAGVDTLSMSGSGKLIVDSTCLGGTINIRGSWEIVDSSGGAVTIIYDDNTAGIAGNSTKLDDLQGAGFVTANDSNKAIRDRGDIAWLTGAGGSAPTVVQIRQEMDTNSAQFAQIVADLLAMQGATFDGLTDSLEAIRDRGDVAWVTGGAGSAPTVTQIRQEMDTNSTQFAQIVSDVAGLAGAAMRGTDGANTLAPDNAGIAQTLVDIAAVKGVVDTIVIDTNELQSDWTAGGRLDLILAAIDGNTTTITLSPAERDAIADAWLDRDMAAGTDTGSPTKRTNRQALRSNRNRVTIVGGIMTIYKENDATVSWSGAITTAPGNPLSEINPT